MENNQKNSRKKKDDKSSWAIGGGLLVGLGIGFFFLQTSALIFVGSTIAGLGLGIIMASLLSKCHKDS